MLFSSILSFSIITFPLCTRYVISRGINDLLSTSSDMIAALCFRILYCLSVDHLHVNHHVVLFKHVVVLIGSLLIYLSGKLEDVVVLELNGEVAAFEVFI